MAEHARMCSPSGASGWFACPGRIVMEAPFPDTGSASSDDGTARHEFCAEALNTGLNMPLFLDGVALNGVAYRREWVAEDQDYVDTVRALADGGELFVERVVNFEQFTGVPGDSFGTADAIVLRPITLVDMNDKGPDPVLVDTYELIIVDRKTGYHEVPAERNKQLMLYALGAYAEFGLVYDIARVRLIIHQRAAREWDCSIDELLEFGEEAQRAAQRVQEAVNDRLTPADEWMRIHLNPDPSEDACRYCKAMATCPSMQAKVQDIVGADFETLADPERTDPVTKAPGLLSEYDLDCVMSSVALLEDFTKAVRAEMERRLLAGGLSKRFKLVLGKQGNRKWSDDKAAEDLLRKQFRLPVEVAYDLSVISPTTAEKLAKAGTIGPRQWKAAQGLITRSEPKPSVAPASDKRDVYVPPNPADDFAAIPEPQSADVGAEYC